MACTTNLGSIGSLENQSIKRELSLSFYDMILSSMLAIGIQLPPEVIQYLNVTPFPVMMTHALLALGWIPIFGVVIWGLTHIWMDYKQGQYNASLKWQLLEVNVPQDAIQTPKGMENFFMNLSGVKSGITWRETWLIGKFQAMFSFEIVSNEGQIKFLIRTLDKYRDLVEAALYAQYPEAQIMEIPDYVQAVPNDYPNEEYDVFGSEMVLSNKSYFPIRTFEDFEHQGEKDARFKDPLLPIIEMMGKMKEKEHFWIQMIIQPPDSQTWVKEGAEYLNTMMGKEKKHAPGMMDALMENVLWLPKGIASQVIGMGSADEHAAEKKDDFRMFRMTSQERLMMEAVAEKISKVGWKTKIRWLYAGPKKKFRKGLMASSAKGMFATFTHQYLNGLSIHGPATPKDDYIWQAWAMPGKQSALVTRYQKRMGGVGANWQILNVEELATLFHFPAADARTPVLTKTGARRAEAPDTLGFAGTDEPQLPNWKRTAEEGKEEERIHNLPDSVLAVPTPMAPTEFVVPTPEPVPSPLPTPVPSRPITEDEDSVPPNLPV